MTKNYIDTIYNTSRRPFTSYPSKLAKEISTRCELSTGMSFLDFGCGRGELSSAFNKIGLAVTGCDRDPAILKYFEILLLLKLILRLIAFRSMTIILMLFSVSQLLSTCTIR